MSIVGDIVGGATKFISGGADLLSTFNPVDIGKDLIKEIVPDEYDFLVDVAALGVNVYTGNWAGAIDDFGDLAKDLKKADVFGDMGPAAEPTPPPGAAPDPAKTAPTAPHPPTPDPAELTANPASRRGPGAFGATPAPTAPTSAPANSSSSIGDSAGITDKAQAWLDQHKNPQDLLNAIRNGQIHPDVANDKAAMLTLQQRVQDFSQLITLMTNMMNALHEMQMSVARNIRA